MRSPLPSETEGPCCRAGILNDAGPPELARQMTLQYEWSGVGERGTREVTKVEEASSKTSCRRVQEAPAQVGPRDSGQASGEPCDPSAQA